MEPNNNPARRTVYKNELSTVNIYRRHKILYFIKYCK